MTDISPLIYTPEKSIEVFEKTEDFLKEEELENDITEILWVYHSVGDLIPQTETNLWSGHFFPYGESWRELQVSLNLCFFGFYKQSLYSVRSTLEVGLLSVYWNLFDKGHKEVQEWLKAEEKTPYTDTIWQKLKKHENIQTLQQSYDIKSKLDSLNYLHDYVHSRGYEYSNYIGLHKSNFQTFEERGLKLWLDSAKEVVKVLTILHLAKYPIGTIKFNYSRKFGIDKPAFGGLDKPQIDRIVNLIGEDVYQILHNIAKEDETVSDIMNWVKGLPDMTEEDVEQQILDFDKERIKHNGIKNWLEGEAKILEEVPNKEEYKDRIRKLVKWAIKNGYKEPARKREDE